MTPIWDGMPKEQLEEFMATIRQKLPTGEIGNAEDVAESYM